MIFRNYFHTIPKSERKEKLVSNEAVEFATNIAIDVAETLKISPDSKHAPPEYVPIVTPLQSLPQIKTTGARGAKEAQIAELEKCARTNIEQTIPLPNAVGGLSWFRKRNHTISEQDTPPSSPSSSSATSSITKLFGLRWNNSSSSESMPTGSNEQFHNETLGGQTIVAVNDEIVAESVKKVTEDTVTLMQRKLGLATVNLEVMPIEAGFLADEGNTGSRAKAVYRLTFSCEFGSFANWIIDDVKVKAVFSPKQDDNSAASRTTSIKESLAESKCIDPISKSSKGSGASVSKQQVQSLPAIPTRSGSNRGNRPIVVLPGWPKVHSLAPVEHYGRQDSVSVQRDIKLGPKIPTPAGELTLATIRAQYEDIYHYHWEVKGMREQSQSSNDTVRWRIRANQIRTAGVPRNLKFVALVGHDEEDHRPLNVTIFIRWALRSKRVPDAARIIFGWEDKCNATFPVQLDGVLDKTLYPLFGKQEHLDKMLQEIWSGIERVESQESGQ